MHRVLSGSFIVALMLSGGAFAQVASAPVAIVQNQIVQSQSGQSQSGQSLGDVARAYQAKQQTQQVDGKTAKVITNQDLPTGSSGVPEPSGSDTMTQVSGVIKPDTFSDRSSDQRLSNRLQAEQRAGGLWKERIQEQEYRVADLQARIDRVNAAMHASVGTAQYEGPVNRYQAAQMGRLATMQEMLDQQKQKLAMMQDAARRAGANQ